MTGISDFENCQDPVTDKKPIRKATFSCRIVNIDFELVHPGPYDIQRTTVHPDILLEKVPVIRIFGSTEFGQKTCVHVHQAFPYFYIEYKGALEFTTIKSFCAQLATSINHAVAVSLNKDPNLKVKNQYVLAVLPIKGVPFYGYYKGHRCFLKIYLLNPNIVSRVTELLQMGAIMGTVFQPYEAHIPFLLQFFIDYNLYGMNYINLDDVVARVNSYEKQPWDDSVMVKETVCEIEVDTVVGNIVNKDLIIERDIHTMDSEVNDHQVNARLVHSLHALWQDEEVRRKEHLSPTEAKSQTEDRRYSPWNNETALRDMIHKLIERSSENQETPSVPLVRPETDLMDKLMTAYQAIDGLFQDTPFLDVNAGIPQSLTPTEILVDDVVVSQRFSSQGDHNEDSGSVDVEVPQNVEGNENDSEDDKFWEQFESIDDDEFFNVNVDNQIETTYRDGNQPEESCVQPNEKLIEGSSNHNHEDRPHSASEPKHLLNQEILNTMSISDEPVPINFATCPIAHRASIDNEDNSSCSLPIRKIPQFDGPGDLVPLNNSRLLSERQGNRTPIVRSASRKFCRIVNKSSNSNRRLLYQAKNRESNQKVPRVAFTTSTIPILPASPESPTKRKTRDFHLTSKSTSKRLTEEKYQLDTGTFTEPRRRINFQKYFIDDDTDDDQIESTFTSGSGNCRTGVIMDCVEVPCRNWDTSSYLTIECSHLSNNSMPKSTPEAENNEVAAKSPSISPIQYSIPCLDTKHNVTKVLPESEEDKVDFRSATTPRSTSHDVLSKLNIITNSIETNEREYFTKNITTMWSPSASPVQEAFEQQPIIEILSIPNSPVKNEPVSMQHSGLPPKEAFELGTEQAESLISEVIVPATAPCSTQRDIIQEDIEVVIPASNISREQFIPFIGEAKNSEVLNLFNGSSLKLPPIEKTLSPDNETASTLFEIEVPPLRYSRESFLICTTSPKKSDYEQSSDQSSIGQLEREYEDVYSSQEAVYSDFVDDEYEDDLSSSSLSDVVEVTPTKKRRHGVLFSNWRETYKTPGKSDSDDEFSKLLVVSTPTKIRSQHDMLERDKSPFNALSIRKGPIKIRSQPVKKKWVPQSLKERRPYSLSLKRISDFKPKDNSGFTFLDVLMKSKKERNNHSSNANISKNLTQKDSTVANIAGENHKDVSPENNTVFRSTPSHIGQSLAQSDLQKTDAANDINFISRSPTIKDLEKGKGVVLDDDPFRVESQLATESSKMPTPIKNVESDCETPCVLRLGPTSSQLRAIEHNDIYHTGDTPQYYRNRVHSPSPFKTPTRSKDIEQLSNVSISSCNIPNLTPDYKNTPSTPTRYSFKQNMEFLVNCSTHSHIPLTGRRSINRSQEGITPIIPHNPFTTSSLRPSTPGRFSITDHIGSFKIPVSPYGGRKAVVSPILNKFLWGRKVSFIYQKQPPSLEFLEKTWKDYGLPTINYQAPFFSNDKDVPEKPRLYAGKLWKIKSKSTVYLKEFETYFKSNPINGSETHTALSEKSLLRNKVSFWTSARAPPTPQQVEQWLQENKRDVELSQITTPFLKRLKHPSQIEPTTPKNRYGFKLSQFTPASSSEHQIDILCIEVIVDTRKTFLPDPNVDSLKAICYAYKKFSNSENGGYLRTGCIMVKSGESKIERIAGHEVDCVADERALIDKLAGLVHQLDPDILGGFEIHKSSWGYLTDRAKLVYGMELQHRLSRMLVQNPNSTYVDPNKNSWNYKKSSTFAVTGRHVLNIWRIMRGEVSLNIYSYENLVFHVLHQRIPHFKHSTITKWINHTQKLFQLRAIRYYIDRANMNIRLLEQTDVLNRTVEFAKVFGVDFFSVISRGSQFKVESMLCRIAKPENYLLISPSRAQVAEMRAVESLPLVMEPESNFYTSPVVVLDFQSLYPSIMIAYNYCYSTCLGRIQPNPGTQKFGVTSYTPPMDVLSRFEDQLNVAPNGVAYLKPSVRKGLLGKMLTEILDTRVMVKKSMGRYKNDKALTSLLNARQLSLKFIANVTYGYTGASFSGRMPSVEIADSIVQTGRETLEKTIDLINSTTKWGAKVIYGDTDSVFIHIPGASRDQAFDIGNEIAETVTQMNPQPIKLKFEKVYHPCVMITKKRYVGFKYEAKTDTVPVFEAKGIETVRRDGCLATQKMMENCLKLLFRTQDLSLVKDHLQAQWAKILAERVAYQDFFFAKEVKLGTYNESHLPPGALVSARKMAKDPNADPQYGERVSYLVVYGGPNSRLMDQVVSPEEFIKSKSLRLNGHYYITKQIVPSLSRVFNLLGADVQSWYDEMPKSSFIMKYVETMENMGTSRSNSRATIDQFFKSKHCLICGEINLNEKLLCNSCLEDPQTSIFHLTRSKQYSESRVRDLQRICNGCTGFPINFKHSAEEFCQSLDCPIFYDRLKANQSLEIVKKQFKAAQELFWY